ncbi:hypothetical protein TG4357_00108 [Thalassovita gelatinovora]|uniref:Uncharacterized protein n=1 Tax=Thalassovita gelatinovora TaxID=53501 RepID=A0A0P1F3Z9_THAGE|nr:hypothetical protein TG4357_00108 [Thalassovita gelatinovora]SEQ04417.1 hypothetical protein SAMN04488043_1038 [Thalassovita gelatinovora]
MHPKITDMKRARLGRLFELIRQKNLSDQRRRHCEEPLKVPQAAALCHAASESLSPFSQRSYRA